MTNNRFSVSSDILEDVYNAMQKLGVIMDKVAIEDAKITGKILPYDDTTKNKSVVYIYIYSYHQMYPYHDDGTFYYFNESDKTYHYVNNDMLLSASDEVRIGISI